MKLRYSIFSLLMAILLIGSAAYADDGDFMLFTADDGVHGRELWKTDGTVEGTVIVKDIIPGEGGLAKDWSSAFYKLDDSVLFRISKEKEQWKSELWKSDGTSEGTVLVKKIAMDNQPCRIKRMFRVRNNIYFIAVGAGQKRTLWRTDGTEEGTVFIKVLKGKGDSIRAFTYSQDALYQISYNPLNKQTELWRDTFSQDPSTLIKVLGWPYSELICIKDSVYFIAEDSANDAGLWKSDGTQEGCVKVRDFKGAARSNGRFCNFFDYNGMLYFTVYDSEHGVELWKSDGTAADTVMVKDIEPGKNGSYPYLFTIMNGVLYFSFDNEEANTIWRSDGTDKGTIKAVTLPGVDYPGIYEMFAHRKKLYFKEGYGYNRLWKSDGTDQGTSQIISYRQNSRGDSERKDQTPYYFGTLEDTIFFTKTDKQYGFEIWSYDSATGSTSLLKDINPGKGNSLPLFPSLQ